MCTVKPIQKYSKIAKPVDCLKLLILLKLTLLGSAFQTFIILFPLSFSSPPLPSLLFLSFLPFPSLSLEVGPQIELESLGELCKLP